MTRIEGIERANLLTQIFSADSLEKVKSAKRKWEEYLEKHPDDLEIVGYGEMLIMLESAFYLLAKSQK
ncbi:MAG: hypothetical protein QXS68_05825 [Candidatus Methanomethylicaceae archaeon]